MRCASTSADVPKFETAGTGSLRTNHVAFLERLGVANQTVSRRHVHILYEPDGRGFCVLDDGSEHGTGIIRHGRTLAVPRGARGVRLESGDEIVLGEARVRVRFGETRNILWSFALSLFRSTEQEVLCCSP